MFPSRHDLKIVDCKQKQTKSILQIVLKEEESLGFGIIEYDEAEHAEKAHKVFSGHKINDSVIDIAYCIPGMSAVHMFNRIMFKYVSIHVLRLTCSV